MRVSILVLPLVLMTACKHTPTQEEMEKATHQRDIGVSAMHAGDYRQALGELLKGEQLNPDDSEIQYSLALTYFNGFGRLVEAEKHYKRAIALKPDYSDAYNGLGAVYMERGEYERAIPLFEKAMSNLLWPTPFQAEQNLGWALYKLGKTEQGIAHLKAALNMNSSACGAYDRLGQIYSDTQRDQDVIVWLERFLQKCDTDQVRKFLPPQQVGSVYYRLAMAYARGGDHEHARQHLSTCVERFADHEVAQSCRKNLSLLVE